MKLIHGKSHPVFGRIYAEREDGFALVLGGNALYVWIDPYQPIVAAYGDQDEQDAIATALRALRQAEVAAKHAPAISPNHGHA